MLTGGKGPFGDGSTTMIGARLGPWVIDRELGRGGMGSVYLAHADPPPADGPKVAAVKVLAAELVAEPGFVQRFEREIEILRKLDHPHIVHSFDSGLHQGRPWFAMEYVDGRSLDLVLEERRRLPWREALELAWQIAPALKHAHDRGVIHRDLKPSNLLLAADPDAADGVGVVKLTDFGIASLFASRHLTVTGGVVGTAEYLSPEQAAGKPVTRRSDLYSFGAVLYTLVTGRTPFVGDVMDLLHKHRFGQFDRPIRVVPDIHPEFDAVICELLEKDPANRPGDGAVLFRRLDGLKRKLDRQRADPTSLYKAMNATDPKEEGPARTGPATLMSRLMRRELELQNRGGPWRRFLNRPVVLLLLFAVTLGVLVWTFWPLSDETLFDRGARLMASSNPDDWDRAWDDYLGPLEERHSAIHPAEMEEFRRRRDDRQAEREAARAARNAGPTSEAQWFYQKGLRQRQEGNEEGARKTWLALIDAFRETRSMGPWVRRAEKELKESDGEENAGKRDWGPVREALKRARQLEEDGDAEQAEAIRQGLKELYRNDEAAQEILKGE